MLGTPNDGSPWPRVVDWAITALSIGLNELGKVAWPATVLAGLVPATKWIKITLAQMAPHSPFIRDLYSSTDPKIPYTLLAGNTSLVPTAGEDAERQSKLRRLLARLWSDRTKYDLASLFFGGADNDIAVSLESMRYLPPDRSPACDVRPVACDHLSYFRHPEALKNLASVL
jgi:hypothetical protein